MTDPMVGRILDGRYRVEERVARGGMATVYRATDTRLDRQIALKIMQPAFADDPEFVDRFTREARAAARLSDPHVVAVFDQGEDQGVVFLAMEFIPGRTLRDLLTLRGRLNPRETVNIMIPVVQALAAAHRSGLVHRDVKPENVLIGDDGRVRVADFGLARGADASSSNNATRGVLIGTVAYLAPEQVTPGVSDKRSDVYAAGIWMYVVLTGRPPFDGDEPIAVAYQHVHEVVPAPSLAVPAVPAALDDVVRAATQRDPARRPADATELLQLLQALPAMAEPSSDSQQTVVVPLPSFPGEGTQSTHRSTSVTAVAGAGTAGALTDVSPDTEPPLIRKRRGRGFIALGLVILLAVGAGSLAWWLGPGRHTSVPSVAGLVAKQAEAKLTQEGLTVAYANPAFSEVVPDGDVIASDPQPGARIANGGTVTLTLSKGPERFDVPNVVGVSVDVAQQRLAEQSLVVGSTRQTYSETTDKGLVISSAPRQGKSVRADTEVDLVVSRGPAPVPVPQLIGDNVDDARAELESLGLGLSVNDEQYSRRAPVGTIISQRPGSGARLVRGRAVSVVVSLGPPLVVVPSVVDSPVQEATAELEAAGFRVVVYEPFGISPLNRVTSTDPEGGSRAPLGSVVRVGII